MARNRRRLRRATTAGGGCRGDAALRARRRPLSARVTLRIRMCLIASIHLSLRLGLRSCCTCVPPARCGGFSLRIATRPSLGLRRRCTCVPPARCGAGWRRRRAQLQHPLAAGGGDPAFC